MPSPRIVEEKFYELHGLRVAQSPRGWGIIWHSFRASLFHLSLHAAFSDFSIYGHWAKGKDIHAATFAVSLVEDIHITCQAQSKWLGTLPDLAYANFIAALRIPNIDDITNPTTRFATKLLLSSAGVLVSSGDPIFQGEDRLVDSISRRLTKIVEIAVNRDSSEGALGFVDAANLIYAVIRARGQLPEIPYLPHTEAHGACDVFERTLFEGGRSVNRESLLGSALIKIGLKSDSYVANPQFDVEARSILASMEESKAKLTRITQRYEKLIAPSRLESVASPPGDYANFVRIRMGLAGPLKNAIDQLTLNKSAGEDSSGRQILAQTGEKGGVQVVIERLSAVASVDRDTGSERTEAWAILIDTGKSASSFPQETRGLATCLGEVATRLFEKQNQWAMYAFNDSIQVVKDFDEGYDITTRARIGAITQRNSLLLPDAISVVSKSLAQREAALRVLVVVSDGYPEGYSDRGDRLATAIKKASRSGIFLMGAGTLGGAINERFPVNFTTSGPYQLMRTFVNSYSQLSRMF